MNDLTLTDQELEASYLARFDLGPGYPQLQVSDYIKRLYLDDSIEEISLRFPPDWSPEKQAEVDRDLSYSVKQFIGISQSPDFHVFATFSGSIALDRALASLQIIATSNGKKNIRVITTTPCIDIMKLFLAERANVISTFVPSRKGGRFGAIDESAIVEQMKKVASNNKNEQLCVLISSPENPTGEIWTSQQLQVLMTACVQYNVVLIVDHCFVVAGIHSPSSLCRIWDVAPSELKWLAVWDTGKTFGLNEDKLGFLISSVEEICNAIKTALAVLQFGVPRRSKLFYSELLRKASYYDHVAQLREHCQKNYEILSNLSKDNFRVRQMGAGSLALVDISGSNHTDEQVRSILIAERVGVISGNVFFHSDWKETKFIRLALARMPDYFEKSLKSLLEHLP